MINLRAAEPTPEEIFRVASLMEGKPSMYMAVKFLIGLAMREKTKESLRYERN